MRSRKTIITLGKAVLSVLGLIAAILGSSCSASASYLSWCSGLRAADVEEKNVRQVAVSGILTQRSAFGPPNFGENPATDTKWKAWFLNLDHPVSLFPTPSASDILKRVREMQVRGIVERDRSFKRMLNRHVEVIGRLYVPVLPSDVGAVVLEPNLVRRTDEIVCSERVASERK